MNQQMKNEKDVRRDKHNKKKKWKNKDRLKEFRKDKKWE